MGLVRPSFYVHIKPIFVEFPRPYRNEILINLHAKQPYEPIPILTRYIYRTYP